LNGNETQPEGAKIVRQDTRSYGVQGRLTFDSASDLWRQSGQLFAGETVLEIDLAGVTHTDSGGLALLVEWLREASRQGARMTFSNLPEQMRALARAANLEPVLMGERERRQS